MNIKFPKANLQKAINVLQKVSQNKTSQILPGSIYITTKNNQVELQGNDFELGIINNRRRYLRTRYISGCFSLLPRINPQITR